MAGQGTRAGMVMAVAWLLLAGPALGQQEPPPRKPAYKCVSKGRVVYTEVACPGGREVGPAGARRTDRYKTPPQDRAKLARRAQLTPEARQECTALEGRMKQQEAELKARGPSVTIQDETPLIKAKLRFRELKC
ncbi:MAG TPA: hypothetical protein VGD76_00965 [Ramlibacter sp.]